MTAPETAADSCVLADHALMRREQADSLAELFKALADPTRVRLVSYVAAAEEGTVCACDLPEKLGISQPTLSHHLKKLVDAGVLARQQRGRWAHYTIAAEGLASALDFLTSPDKHPNNHDG